MNTKKRIRPLNKATISVTYPDGCKQTWTSRPDVPIAKDAVRFAAWLMTLAEDIHESATRDGMCEVTAPPES